jgi:16S rRNA (guanine527-N7)-methyltransferase
VDTARIAALLDHFLESSLLSSQLDQISTYIDLLLRWNARINLTAIRHPEEIVTRHFGESFFLARHLFPMAAPDFASIRAPEAAPYKLLMGEDVRVLDIGSGAGFPAIPLKIWAPHLHLTLIESNQKKAAFLREVARALTLTNVNVINDRAETVAASPDSPRADFVTLRAVERFETILPHALTLLAPKATLALLIGAAQVPRLATLSTLKWHPPINIPQSHSRVLSVGIRC